MSDSADARPVAIVILPFYDEAEAVIFANMVRSRNDGQTAIVTRGSAIEYAVDVTKEHGQIIEFHGAEWDTYVDASRPDVTIVMRDER